LTATHITLGTTTAPLEKELIAGQIITGEESQLRFRGYKPWLGSFSHHCENFWTFIAMKPTDTVTTVLTLNSWMHYCHSVLRAYAHLALQLEYKLGSIETDSPGKILAQLGEFEVPRWLIDICREICRPISDKSIVYVPIVQGSWTRKARSGPLPSIGIDPSYSAFVALELKKFEVDMRLLTAERLTVSPYCYAEGEHLLVHPSMATWRKFAFYQLQHFQNGCFSLTDSELKATRLRRALHGVAPAPVKQPAPLALLPQDTIPLPPSSLAFLVDRIRARYAAPQLAPVLMATMLGIAQSVIDSEAFQYAPAAGLAPQGFIILYYASDVMAKYNAWTARRVSTAQGLPPEVSRNIVIERSTTVSDRFPTEEMNSKTPPDSGDRSTMRDEGKSKPRRRKKKTKKKATTPEPEPEMASDGDSD
jgi:hypothetical protein